MSAHAKATMQAIMQALTLHPQSASIQVEQLPTPAPGPTELLIRVGAVALNPVDWMFAAHPIATQERRVLGTDFAGTVVSRGSAVDEKIPIGVRVAGFLQGACSTNERPGAFAEYVAIPSDLVWHVPDHLTLEQAASISMCGLTAAQAVFGRLGMPCPFVPSTSPSLSTAYPGDPFAHHTPTEPVNVLVYGSSTSLGLYVAQLVQLVSRTSGQRIRLIGAASRSKHAVLRQKPYAYNVLVDYRSANWTEEVRAATGGKGVDFAVDCISEGETVGKVESTFGSGGGRLAVIRAPGNGGYDASAMRVKPQYGAVWEGLGVEVRFLNGIVISIPCPFMSCFLCRQNAFADSTYLGMTIPANPQAREFATEFYKFLGSGAGYSETMLEPNPVRIMPGGLDRVAPDGFALLSSVRVSDREASDRSEGYMRPISLEKLVYSLIS
ncbi:GroES-like protein [Annulohypoxylon bovei var. microspora]|nr:GroES-like protein [Annulohypoxylon bovei var. microspora]